MLSVTAGRSAVKARSSKATPIGASVRPFSEKVRLRASRSARQPTTSPLCQALPQRTGVWCQRYTREPSKDHECRSSPTPMPLAVSPLKRASAQPICARPSLSTVTS